MGMGRRCRDRRLSRGRWRSAPPPPVLVMVSILLVIDINKAGRQLSSPRDVYTLPRRIKIDAVHPVRGWKVSDFLARLGVHDNHFGRSAGADGQARGRLVEGSVAWALAADLPSRNYLPFVRVDYLDLVGNGNEHKKRRSRPVQQKLRGVGHNFDIADALVFLCVDDSNLSVVLPCVLTTVTDIDKFRMRFVDDAVVPTVKLDRVKKIERVAPKDSEHPVIPACHQ